MLGAGICPVSFSAAGTGHLIGHLIPGIPGDPGVLRRPTRPKRERAPRGSSRSISRLETGLRCWRRHPDSNRGSRICNPLPYHLAMPPQREPRARRGAVEARRRAPAVPHGASPKYRSRPEGVKDRAPGGPRFLASRPLVRTLSAFDGRQIWRSAGGSERWVGVARRPITGASPAAARTRSSARSPRPRRKDAALTETCRRGVFALVQLLSEAAESGPAWLATACAGRSSTDSARRRRRGRGGRR